MSRRWDNARFAAGKFGQPRFGPVARGSGLPDYEIADADAAAFVAAMTAEPNGIRKRLIDTYVLALKAAGVWDKLDILYLLAAHTSQAARLNLKDPEAFTLIDVVAPTFTIDRGFQGNGSTQALSTQFTPSTDGVNFTQDDASLWVWCLTTADEGGADCGAAVTQNSFIRARSAGTTIQVSLNNAVTTSNAIGTAVGLTGVSRNDANNQRIWKNGVELSSAAGTSAGLPTNAFRICGRYNDSFSTKLIANFAAGAYLDTDEGLAYYNATLAYLQGVGAD